MVTHKLHVLDRSMWHWKYSKICSYLKSDDFFLSFPPPGTCPPCSRTRRSLRTRWSRPPSSTRSVPAWRSTGRFTSHRPGPRDTSRRSSGNRSTGNRSASPTSTDIWSGSSCSKGWVPNNNISNDQINQKTSNPILIFPAAEDEGPAVEPAGEDRGRADAHAHLHVPPRQVERLGQSLPGMYDRSS